MTRYFKHGTPKANALAIEPGAVCKATWTRRRCVFNVTVGARTLGTGISPTVAWEKALRKMLSERAINHLDGDVLNNHITNLEIVKIGEHTWDAR